MRFELLAEGDIERIVSAAMRILGKTGVMFLEQESLSILSREGASVDRPQKRVRFPEKMIRQALEKAPRRVRLCAREDSRTVELSGGTTHFTNSATGIRVVDHATGEVRQSVLADIADFARLADALPEIDFFGPTVVAHDVPGTAHFIAEAAEGLRNTTKHVSHECQGTEMTRMYVEMGRIVAGGDEAFRKRPVLSAGGCPVSPLQYDKANTEAMLECVKAGMPFDIMSMAMAGGTAPVTLAGELALITAEVVAGVTLCQLVCPGAPVIFGSVASVMDMRSGILALGAPERALLNSAVVQVAHSLGLPSLVGGLSTDSKRSGDQAMLEKALTCLPPVLAGSDVVFGPGVLSSATTYSLDQMVIDCEAIGAIKRIAKGFSVHDEALALDVIDGVGPGGWYMSSRHTQKYMRNELWMPQISDRSTEESWRTRASKDMRANAHQRTIEMLNDHVVRPLDEDQQRAIDNIIARAVPS